MRLALFTCVGLLLVGAAVATEPDLLASYGVKVDKNLMVRMRDGAHLSVDLYLPASSTGKLPTLLVRTPYDRSERGANFEQRMALVGKGYALAIVSMRGRHESEGRFQPGVGDRNDATDIVEWIVAQPWSDGKIGTMGCSYLGETQLTLAATRNPHQLATVPMASTTGYLSPGRPWEAFDGGVFELAETAGWLAEFGSEVVYGPPAWVDRRAWFNSPAAQYFRQTAQRDPNQYFPHLWDLPIADILKNSGSPPTDYANFVTHNPDAHYFYTLDWVKSTDHIDTPMLFMDSWYDYGPAEAFGMWKLAQKNAVSARARNNQFIIIAPTTHCVYETARGHEHWVVGERDMGQAGLDFVDIQTRWYDHWLKGANNGITTMPKVQYFLMGKNEWRHSDNWPLPNTSYRKFYLHSGGRANSRYGDGVLAEQAPVEEPADAFSDDPATPVPSLGGQACCTGLETGAGAFDQSKTEMRHDVLVYTSEVLEHGLEVTGPLEVVLYVSSSAKDTDFMAKLVDVYPDGRAFNVQEGALRMRYRNGFATPVWMEIGEVYEAHLNLHVTANYFGPGHRLRLEVASTSFPRFDRNLHTGGNNYDETRWLVANNTIHHSGRHPSYLLLPLIEPR